MKKETNKTSNRAGLIDGLPNSYNTSYVITSKKKCELCFEDISNEDIDDNKLICSENFEFFHKKCLFEKGYTYEHQKSDDKTSIIFVFKNDVTFTEKSV